MHAADGLIPAGAGQTTPQTTRTPPLGAHPRRCGANFFDSCPCVAGRGSSPQVRGKPASRYLRPRGSGLIPAGAGQTEFAWPFDFSEWAHPRRCGANLNDRVGGMRDQGSSPQVRGKLLRFEVGGGGAGLIPAGAGQTRRSSSLVLRFRAHPRRCGANITFSTITTSSLGSSPQVRGKPLPTSDVALITRAKGPTLSSHF